MNAPTPPPAWYPDPSRAPGLRYWDGQQWTGYTHDTASAQPAPNKRTRWIAVGIAVVAAIGLFAAVIINMYRTEATSPQIVLPFTGLYNPWAVAVDTTGTVYVADYFTSQVLKLAAGSSTQTVLPFTGLVNPEGVAVDTAGTVYIADHGNNRVVKLAAGSSSQTVLPFTALSAPQGVAVDSAGNVYVTQSGSPRVVELDAGSSTPKDLPNGPNDPGCVAIDRTGNLYVVEQGSYQNLRFHNSVQKADSYGWTKVPLGGVTGPLCVAADAAGNLYVINGNEAPPDVVKLASGSNTQTVLPFGSLTGAQGLAVDTAGNVYVADGGNRRVLKLPAGSR